MDSACSHCEINLTKIQPTSLAGGAPSKIVYNGSNWGGGGVFGFDNLAVGVLS
jgi:hypothetical protein